MPADDIFDPVPPPPTAASVSSPGTDAPFVSETRVRIAEELALLDRIADFPSPPFGYGSDISGALDLSPVMAEVDGFTTLALAQSLVRRLDTPRGSLPDDKNWGISIASYLNAGVPSENIEQIAGQIRTELSLDDRVDALRVRVAPTATAGTISVSIQVQPIDPNLGPFLLTLNASDAGILLEQIESVR